jgi:hypothetical protein
MKFRTALFLTLEQLIADVALSPFCRFLGVWYLKSLVLVFVLSKFLEPAFELVYYRIIQVVPAVW